ncbi:MAG TPA: hypothetical protein VEA38_05320 [Terriglobales bacterium]|nr:hypothetical protein [Terriglobales bacterium]
MNEQISTVRRSSVALGLDLTGAPSRLTSTAAIGLNLIETASALASSAALGLDVTTAEASATLTSTAEANTMPTSYGVIQPTFSAGTSVATLSGTYAGTGAAANATSLTLTITSPGVTLSATVPKAVTIAVKDQNNTDLGSYVKAVKIGDTISLGADIGLSIAFGAGTVSQNATTTFTVSNTTPTTVDANAAFNAGVNVRPRFDANRVVTAGSFKVNGTAVTVLASDTINTVLSRIASTVAGITGSFSGDKVTLRSTNPSEDAITVSDDTSGFLTALNLTGASSVRGNVRDDRQVFSKTSQFAAVTTGAFTLNGVSIAVNAATDSLESVIARINGAGAGVTAAYDSAAGRLRLTSTAASESDIVVGGDTSSFLTAAKLSTANTVRGNLRDDAQALSAVAAFAGVVAGGFTINGVQIGVDPAAQTIQSLATAITASAAGVTAAYDAGTDTVTLTSKTGSDADIVVGNDTSGALGALRLAGATTVRGQLPENVRALAATSRFGGVTDGSFVINGRTITVDADADSLSSVLARITGSGAGVTATYDTAAGKVVLTPDTAGATLVVGSDTSGFLAAAAIATGAAGTRVNTAAAFNGTGADDPLLDPGRAVVAGSFTVNGVTIAVAANDSVTSVLAKITSSAAGVTASFNEATETVRLVSKAGSSTPIAIGDDTSGFLTAVKLDGAVSKPGRLVAGRASAVPTTAAEPIMAAVARINDVLELVGSSALAAGARATLANAIRGAVAAVPVRGLAIATADGEARVVVDAAALEATLARDPRALDALAAGAQSLPEAISVALAQIETAERAATKPAAATAATAAAILRDPQLAAMLRAARATNQLGVMELISSVQLSAAVAVPGALDLLV